MVQEGLCQLGLPRFFGFLMCLEYSIQDVPNPITSAEAVMLYHTR